MTTGTLPEVRSSRQDRHCGRALTTTHAVADGIVSAIVKVTEPADAKPFVDRSPRVLPVTEVRMRMRFGWLWLTHPVRVAGIATALDIQLT